MRILFQAMYRCRPVPGGRIQIIIIINKNQHLLNAYSLPGNVLGALMRIITVMLIKAQ